ncbi:MAG: sialidase family protein, partial [Verrucomicrobia bacterium]|nr:sialidase family protein [Verrucomicrobiota bacterium]
MKSPLLSGLDRLLLLLGSLAGVPDSMSGAPDSAPKPTSGIPANWRNIASGWTIPDEDYADQPYIVKADDGAWVCVITTADGHEGATSQHVVATRSTDFGRTWSPLIAIEPSGPPESSYVTVLKTSAGRLYAFYNYNKDNLRAVKRTDGVMEKRVDTLGYFVFKYSDDHGKTWS